MEHSQRCGVSSSTLKLLLALPLSFLCFSYSQCSIFNILLFFSFSFLFLYIFFSLSLTLYLSFLLSSRNVDLFQLERVLSTSECFCYSPEVVEATRVDSRLCPGSRWSLKSNSRCSLEPWRDSWGSRHETVSNWYESWIENQRLCQRSLRIS